MHSRTRAVALLAALLMAAADATPLAAARAPQGTTAASSNAQGAAGRVWGMQDIVTAVRDRVNDMRNAAGAALPAFEIAPGIMMPAVRAARGPYSTAAHTMVITKGRGRAGSMLPSVPFEPFGPRGRPPPGRPAREAAQVAQPA